MTSENKDRQTFEDLVQLQIQKLNEELNGKGREIDPLDLVTEETSKNKIFPHEFLFLIINAKDRLGQLVEEQTLNLNISKKCIKAYEMEEVDAARLDYIYDLDVKDMRTDKNPLSRMKL